MKKIINKIIVKYIKSYILWKMPRLDYINYA